MSLQSSGLLLSQALLPVVPGRARGSRGQAASALGPGRLLCSGQETPADFLAVISFHAMAYS